MNLVFLLACARIPVAGAIPAEATPTPPSLTVDDLAAALRTCSETAVTIAAEKCSAPPVEECPVCPPAPDCDGAVKAAQADARALRERIDGLEEALVSIKSMAGGVTQNNAKDVAEAIRKKADGALD